MMAKALKKRRRGSSPVIHPDDETSRCLDKFPEVVIMGSPLLWPVQWMQPGSYGKSTLRMEHHAAFIKYLCKIE